MLITKVIVILVYLGLQSSVLNLLKKTDVMKRSHHITIEIIKYKEFFTF